MKKTSENTELKKLKEELKNLRIQMKINDGMFDIVSDENLVDSLIYEKMSLTARHGYLINKIREFEKLNQEIKV